MSKLAPSPRSSVRFLPRSVRAVALALGTAALTFNLAPTVSRAAAPLIKTQAPGFYRVMVGDFEVTALSDGTIDLDLIKMLKAAPGHTEAALQKAFLASPVETSVNAFLINTGAKLVLVDAGTAGLFGPSLGKLLANLQAAGYKAEQVDEILISHLHPDHVGGLMNNGAIAFPRATVHADKRDADFWLSQANLDKAPAEGKSFFEGAMASVNPYVKAGRFQAFAANGEVVPGIRSVSSYGHTAGHTSYVVESKGHKLVLIGDLIHAGAVQFHDPSVTFVFDADPRTSELARATVFKEVAKDGVLIGASHLPFPALGHLRAAGKGWQWVPLGYSLALK